MRAVRYRLRDGAARALPVERVARCGRHAHLGHVSICNGEHGAYFGGVVTCGSVWSCPVCAAKIAERRRQEVEETIKAHVAAGGVVYMAAFTVPHQCIQTARELRSLVAGTWKKVISGSPWLRWKARAGVVGSIRALEVTHGKNGWHPHLHVLFLFPGNLSEESAQEFGGFLFDRWARAVERRGYGWCNPSLWRFERTQETQRAGDYVTKWGADRELTQGHRKRAKGGGRTPWQILEGIAAGSKADIMLFRDYAEAFKGARQLTWSRGLRELYGLREAVSDGDACLDGPKEQAPVIGILPIHVFIRVRERGLAAGLLNQIEAHPFWPTVIIFLREHGIDYYEPPPESSRWRTGPTYSGPPRS